MYAHYTVYTKQGKKVHMISITPTPSMREGSKESKFDTAKEAKQYAKAILFLVNIFSSLWLCHPWQCWLNYFGDNKRYLIKL